MRRVAYHGGGWGSTDYVAIATYRKEHFLPTMGAMASRIESATARQVGRRIAELRRKRGRTQERLSEEAGMTLRYLQEVESGSQNLGILTLEKFADLLGVKVIELFRPPKSRKVRRGRPPKLTR